MQDKLNSWVIITDNGVNIVSAFDKFKRLSCSCRNKNLVIDDFFFKNTQFLKFLNLYLTTN